MKYKKKHSHYGLALSKEGRINKVSDVLTSEAIAEIHGVCRDTEVGRLCFFLKYIACVGQRLSRPSWRREGGNSEQDSV